MAKCAVNYVGACQFPHEPAIYQFLGYHWCRFHLPVTDADGTNFSEKKSWSLREIRNFNRAVIDAVNDQRKEGFLPYDVGFYAVQFPGDVDFSKEELREFNCSSAVFFGGAIFSESDFEGYANFAGTTFHGFASFWKARFSHVSFQEARFLDLVSFLDAEFGGTAVFEDAEFQFEARFRDASFFLPTSFKKATFKKGATFSWAPTPAKEFREKVDTSGSPEEFPKPPARVLNRTNMMIDAKFDDCRFAGPVVFENRHFGTSTSFRGVVFSKAPEFFGALLHEGMVFPQEENFLDVSGSASAAAYAKLKRAMEDLRRYDEEAKFFALEQRSLRNDAKVDWPIKAVSWLYEELSDYGRSFIRPVIWWFVLVGLAFPFLLYPVASLFGGASTSEIDWDLLEFSFSQAIVPFSAWVPKYAADVHILEEMFGASGVWIGKGIALVESIFSLALTALFLLALRRRFKLG